MKTSQTTAHLPWIVRITAVQRLLIAIAAGLAAWIIHFTLGERRQTALLVAWNVGSWAYLALAALVIVRADAAMTRARVRNQDQSGYVIFLLVLGAALASIGAIGFLMGEIRSLAFWPRAWHLALSIAALIAAWLLIQMLFAFHYARRYYGDNPEDRGSGLKFPRDPGPDYLDFAYYSFVIGMTFQVSDVEVTSRTMRRLTLIHAILSFIFNIAIVAISVNIISGVL